MGTKNFDAFFEREIKPHIEDLKQSKSEAYRKLWAAAAVIIAINFIIISNVGYFSIFFLAIADVIVLIIIFSIVGRSFVEAFEKNITSRVVTFISPDLQYKRNEHITEEEYKISKLHSTGYDSFTGGNLIEGIYEGVYVRFSYLYITREETEEETDIDGNTHTTTRTVTIFNGTFFISDFNKKFKGEVFVFPRTLHIFKSSRRVILENPKFHEIFDVYSNDQILARYIISTSMMERLMSLKQKFDKHRLHISFIDSKMYLTISGFDPCSWADLHYDLEDMRLYKKYSEKIESVLGIVKDLNLNLHIWG